MRQRNTELAALFKRFYEGNVLGSVANKQFCILSGDYNAEQSILIVYRDVSMMDNAK